MKKVLFVLLSVVLVVLGFSADAADKKLEDFESNLAVMPRSELKEHELAWRYLGDKLYAPLQPIELVDSPKPLKHSIPDILLLSMNSLERIPF